MAIVLVIPIAVRYAQQDPRWKVEQITPATFRWTTPSGWQYTTESTRYPILGNDGSGQASKTWPARWTTGTMELHGKLIQRSVCFQT